MLNVKNEYFFVLAKATATGEMIFPELLTEQEVSLLRGSARYEVKKEIHLCLSKVAHLSLMSDALERQLALDRDQDEYGGTFACTLCRAFDLAYRGEYLIRCNALPGPLAQWVFEVKEEDVGLVPWKKRRSRKALYHELLHASGEERTAQLRLLAQLLWKQGAHATHFPYRDLVALAYRHGLLARVTLPPFKFLGPPPSAGDVPQERRNLSYAG